MDQSSPKSNYEYQIERSINRAVAIKSRREFFSLFIGCILILIGIILNIIALKLCNNTVFGNNHACSHLEIVAILISDGMLMWIGITLILLKKTISDLIEKHKVQIRLLAINLIVIVFGFIFYYIFLLLHCKDCQYVVLFFWYLAIGFVIIFFLSSKILKCIERCIPFKFN